VVRGRSDAGELVVLLVHVVEKNSDATLFVQQFCGMLVKRVTNTARSWLLTASQFVPVIFTVWALVVIRTLPGPGDSPPLAVDLSRLPNTVVAYSSSANESGRRLADAYVSYLRDHFGSVRPAYVNNVSGYEVDPDVLRYLSSEGERSLATYNRRYSVACEMSGDLSWTADGAAARASMLFNNQGFHAAAITLGTFTNALLRVVAPHNTSLLTVNHPLPRTLSDTVNDEISQGFEGMAIAVNLQFGMSFLAASFVLFVIRERSIKSKHCQFVSGAGVATFWLAAFVWDLVNYCAPCAGVLVAFAAFDVQAFVGDGRFLDMLLLLLLYAWAVLPFMYLLSFIFAVPSSGFVWLTVFNILLGNFLTAAVLYVSAFNALTLLVGRQEQHPTCKN